MTSYVLTCDEANVIPASSSSTGTVAASCSAPYYAPAPSFLPALSMADGGAIGLAILAAWAIAKGWVMLSHAVG